MRPAFPLKISEYDRAGRGYLVTVEVAGSRLCDETKMHPVVLCESSSKIRVQLSNNAMIAFDCSDIDNFAERRDELRHTVKHD